MPTLLAFPSLSSWRFAETFFVAQGKNRATGHCRTETIMETSYLWSRTDHGTNMRDFHSVPTTKFVNERINSTCYRFKSVVPLVPSLRYRGFIGDRWSRRQDSNPRPAVYKTAALPLSYVGNRWTVYFFVRVRVLTSRGVPSGP